MSNFINKFLFWLVLTPSSLYRRFDVNIPHLKSILLTKLIMDDRRPSGLQRVNYRKNEDVSAATVFTMLTSLLMGAVFLFSFSFDDDITRLTAYFTFFIIMLSLLLITDFSHVLIDVKDNLILLSKPLNPSTFLAARLLHILIHISKIVIPLSLPGLIAMAISRGVWGALLFIPTIALLTLFTLFVVNAAYLLILQVFSPEKFNSIITYIQIVFAILAYGSFQLLPHMITQSALNQIDISDNMLMWLLPSYWFAGLWKFFYMPLLEAKLLASVLLSIVMPLFSTWLVVKFFAPTFHRKLSLISANTSESISEDEGSVKVRRTNSIYISTLSKILTSLGPERGAFLFTWKMVGRSKEFKMKIYPQFGILLVIFLLPLLKGNDFTIENFRDGNSKLPILFMIYLTGFLFFNAIFLMPYSNNFRASWIFLIPPIKKPGKIMSGAVKACVVKFCFPIMLSITVVGTFLVGYNLLPNLLLGFANVLLLCSIIARITLDELPFSVSQKNMSEGQNSFRSLLLLVFLAVCGVPHYFLYDYPLVTSILALLSFVGFLLVLRSLKDISWNKLNIE